VATHPAFGASAADPDNDIAHVARSRE
jgi:hypothetical protein